MANDKVFKKSTKDKSLEGIGVRTDIDSAHPLQSIERSAGSSVEEHKQMERANEYIADEELNQINENS